VALQGQIEKNWPTEFRKPAVLKLKRGRVQENAAWRCDGDSVARQTCCSPPFHKFRSPEWWLGHKKNRKRQWWNWNCVSSSRHKLHETYGRCGVSDQRREYYGVGRSSKKGGNLYYILSYMCVLWTFSSYMTWQIIPPLQHTETGNWPSDETWCVSWLVHARLASVQAGREVCPSELHSLTFSVLYKKYQAVQKCVLCV